MASASERKLEYNKFRNWTRQKRSKIRPVDATYSWHIYLRLDHLPLKPDENSVSFACSADTDSLCWNLGSFQKQAQKPVQKQELQSTTTFFSVKCDNMGRIFLSYIGMNKPYGNMTLGSVLATFTLSYKLESSSERSET